MAKTEHTKSRLLALMDILRSETDEEHHLGAPALLRLLLQRGIPAERKSLYRDLETLEDAGWDILHDRDGYYLASDVFELAELKLLADSVQCSRFITERKSYELIDKLSTLTSRHRASQLRRQLHLVGRAKARNEHIYYNIDAIYSAMNQNRQIRFDYMEWRQDGTRQKRGGTRQVSPYGLCWDNENYYLIAHRDPDGRRHYRVDRMERIEITDEARLCPEQYRDLNMASYAKQVFGMFGGTDASVVLHFKPELADSAIDKFGSDIIMVPQPDGGFTVTANVSVSPTFFSWVFSFSGRVEIVAPEHVRAEYRRMCLQAAETAD